MKLFERRDVWEAAPGPLIRFFFAFVAFGGAMPLCLNCWETPNLVGSGQPNRNVLVESSRRAGATV